MKFRFRRLVKQHQDRLYSLALHMLGNSAEAEDVVQDTMIKLWHQLPNLDSERIRPWLLRVTRNASVDLIRRRQYQTAYAVAAGAEGQAVVTSTPVEALENSDLNERLSVAIGELNEPFQSLIVLREIQGHSYQEIGEVLELSTQQVKVYLHRARRKLRDSLGNLNHE
jgi:RNA polymerase sigma-70 factor (ECF subfamily)